MLPQPSVAVATTVLVEFDRNTEPEGGVEVTVTLLHVSVAVIDHVTMVLVLQVETTMLLEQKMVGGVVSTTVTVCEQGLLLVQQSVARHVRVMIWGQLGLLVIVLMTVIVTFVPQQASTAVGWPKVQALPHSTILLLAQVMTGGVVSTTVTFWVQTPRVAPEQLSMMNQVLIMI